jgi:cell division protein ZapA (FtsZ GTPase activity inhibitor)
MDQSITLKIAGKDYPLKASSPEMEQIMRIAAEAINKRLGQYNEKFPDKELLDKLVFVTLNETINRIATQRKLAAREEGEKKLLDEMTSYLDSIDRK